MPDNNRRVATKDPAEKVAHKRLSVFYLAESLGNVTEACRKSGMDRASFYIWKKRFTEQPGSHLQHHGLGTGFEPDTGNSGSKHLNCHCPLTREGT
jgi:hypothetical protein